MSQRSSKRTHSATIQIMGLERWLNSKYAGQGGYARYLMSRHEPPMERANIFNVTPQAINKWDHQHAREQGGDK